ncbi:multidrug resistance secretion protein [Klebsiella pneumoniae]|uniref:Multidrug resistance secretion protein n=1 Tax=Klebsiella pneumoniae TaxID=573 RepID=A0A378F2U5_KLEPN|nr:multidrug resistance secretion protein [Klebsiella pneumoniae]
MCCRTIPLRGMSPAWRRRPAHAFSILPAENATGNFTKIVQRVPVRIALEGDGAKLDVLRPGLSVIVTVNEKSPR